MPKLAGPGSWPAPPTVAMASPPATHAAGRRRLWLWIGGGIVVALAAWAGIPWVLKAFRTVSTDDAYVNGHVTFVAPRVAGQVAHVLVDDNNRVRKGDLLVQLDKEPFQVQLALRKQR